MPPGKLTYAPGLDGVRALAVIAVMAYHLGTTGLTVGGGVPASGGFIGVDIFFVLSGFLITSLLLSEFVGTGRISIRDFYIRRARRLLPALYTMLAVVSLVASFGFPAYAAHLGGDLVAALTYVTNWWLIAGQTSYFGAGVHPPLLTHLWSLAVEEQFYLLWPLALIGLAKLRKRSSVICWVSAAIVASTLLAAVLYNPYGDPSRIYYGTDTRMATPLLGALLAIMVRPWRWRGERSGAQRTKAQRRTLDVVGFVAIALLLLAVVFLNDQSEVLYRGGFLVIAVLAGLLVVAAARTDSTVGRLLGVAPLRWLGERSYAIYLWHWPIFALTQPGVNLSWNPVLDTVVRVGLTLLVADLSYRLIERPLRSGALGRAVKAWRASTGQRRTSFSTVVAGIALLLVGGIGLVGTQLASVSVPSGAPVGPGPNMKLGALALPSAHAGPSKSHPSPKPSGSPRTGATSAPTKPPPLVAPATVPRVAIFGDSQGMTLLLNKPSDTGKYIAFKDDTIEGCGVLLGKITSRSGERHDLTANCPNWLSVWRGRAKHDKPDIGLVMIGAWDVFNIQVSGENLTFGTAAWDANFSAALASGITAIHASVAQVALALLPCYRPVHASAGFWPERGDDWRTRHVNTLLTAAAAADPAYVSTVEPPHQFCDNPKIAKSLSYRWDGVHYYKPGALLYMTAVIPQLLKIAEPLP